MINTTALCSTLDEIRERTFQPKIIVIGGGGLGKTTLVNKLTNAKFDTSSNSQDGTFNFQGASVNCNGKDILVVDSPGYRLNEDRWWHGVMLIEKIIGVIIMHKYEHRNTGYGNFGYVLAYLNQQTNTKVKKFLLDHSRVIEPDNYMCGSDLVKSEALTSIYSIVEEWMQRLDESAIQIISPIALIDEYRRSMKKADQLEERISQLDSDHLEAISNYKSNINDLEKEIRRVKDEKNEVERSREQLENIIEELPNRLALFDDNSKGYLPDAPHWTHYIYSWLPLVGIAHLNSLRMNAEKNHQIAREMVDIRKKKKKK